MTPAKLDYRSLRSHLQRGELTAREVVDFYLHRAETKADLNAFISLEPEGAIRRAEEVEAALRRLEKATLTSLEETAQSR